MINLILINFCWCCPCDKIIKLINFHLIIKSVVQSNHFCYLIQTDLIKQELTSKEFWAFKVWIFFDLFRVAEELYQLIRQKNRSKILQGTEKMTRADNKLVTLVTLVKINFSLKAFASLKTKKYNNLRTAAQDLCHFVEVFRKLHWAKDFVYICMVEDPMQKLETSICGPFQPYFLTISLIPTKIVGKNNHDLYKMVHVGQEKICY